MSRESPPLMARVPKNFRLRTLMVAVVAVAGLAALGRWWVGLDDVLFPPSVIAVEVEEALPGRPIFGERLIRPDGTITLGYYGNVSVAGLTLDEIKEKVALHLRNNLSDEALGLVRVGRGSDEAVKIRADSRKIRVRLVSLNVTTRHGIRVWPPLGPFWLSLRVASLATLLIVVVGLPIAYLLARGRFFGNGLIGGLLLLPLVLPPTVLGFALLQILGRRAMLGRWLESAFGMTLVFHWSGAVVASAVAAFPLFLIPARAAFEGVDRGLEDVARLLGRGEASVFRHVTLPLAWRGLVAGMVLAFARALGDFGATLMVAGDLPGRTRTASLAIYDAVQADDIRTAAFYSGLIAVASIAALILTQKARPGRGTGL